MSRRVVVVDSGWGGELVADLIEAELAIVEVVRVIDWRHAPYSRRRRVELLERAETLLAPYWRTAEVVVLGGYEISLVAAELQARHPEQEFVSLQLTQFLGRRDGPRRRALFLSDPRLLRMAECDALLTELKAAGVQVQIPECLHWTELIDEGEMTPEIMAQALLMEGKGVATPGIDTVFVANTHYWDVIEDVRKILRWPVHVIDLRDDLMRDVCRALKLKGGTGKRAK